MNSAIQFRWILLAASLVLGMALFTWNLRLSRNTPQPQPCQQTPPVVAPDGTETVTICMPVEPRLSLPIKAEALFNLPALETGIFAKVLVNLEGDLWLIVVTTILAALMWFKIGQWVDYHRTLTPMSVRKESISRVLSKFLLQTLASISLLGAVFALLPTYHHKSPYSAFVAICCLIWSLTYLACSIWGTRRERKIGARRPA